MELIKQFVDLFLHLDRHLSDLIAQYGSWTYGILFLIVFCETGLVVTPFLPGDSLLFAAGAFAGLGALNPLAAVRILTGASLLGDTTNYWVGAVHRSPGLQRNTVGFLKREYLEKTQAFYERHGGKTDHPRPVCPHHADLRAIRGRGGAMKFSGSSG